MKKTTWLLLLLQLFIFDIFCKEDDSFFSKFHQNTYKIRDQRLELISYNEKYFNFLEAKTYKYNRTTPAINVTANLKISVTNKSEALIQGYKFLSNEYRPFPIRFQVNANKALAANAGGLSAIKNCGNVSTFYFVKDVTYFTCNFVMDETQMPPYVPNGRYKFDIKMLYLNEEIIYAAGFVEIYTPIAYPKD